MRRYLKLCSEIIIIIIIHTTLYNNNIIIDYDQEYASC